MPNFAVGGKTGTGQVAGEGGYAKGKYNSTFVGMLPGSCPKYVILVVVSKPKGKYYGGEVAAPAFAQVAMRTAIAKNLMPECIDEAR